MTQNYIDILYEISQPVKLSTNEKMAELIKKCEKYQNELITDYYCSNFLEGIIEGICTRTRNKIQKIKLAINSLYKNNPELNFIVEKKYRTRIWKLNKGDKLNTEEKPKLYKQFWLKCLYCVNKERNAKTCCRFCETILAKN